MPERSLGTKLALATGAVAVLLLASGVIALWPQQKRATEALVTDHLRALAESIAASYLVFDHDRELHPVGDALNEVARLEMITLVHVHDEQGTLRHETSGAAPTGGDTIDIRRPLPRRPACASCHGDDAGPLGEIHVAADLGIAAAGMQGFYQVVLLVLGLTVLGVVLAVVMFARRMIGAPLNALARTMSRAEEGDFLVRAPTGRQDEIGFLSSAFNKMLVAITDLQATGIERDEDLRQAQQELELQQELEERNRLVQEANASLEHRVGELVLLMDLTRAVTSTLELREVLDEISRRVGETMDIDEFAILLLDEQGRRLRVVSTYGVPNRVKLTRLWFAPGEGVSGVAAQTGRTIVVPDTRQDPRYLHYKGMRPVDGSFLSIPMIYKGRVLGVLDFFHAEVNTFDGRRVPLLTAVAGQAALAIANAQLFEARTTQALTDPLTELLNRRALAQRIEEEVHRAQRFGNELSALMIDIDHFKAFNDRHGHLLGDHVLKQVARTLRRHLRKVDTLARYGGEEFCVLLVRTSRTRAHEVAEKLRRAVEKRTFARIRADRRLAITISVGVATLAQELEGPTPLLDAADAALYAAKREGRNCVRVYSPAAVDGGGDGTKTARPSRARSDSP